MTPDASRRRTGSWLAGCGLAVALLGILAGGMACGVRSREQTGKDGNKPGTSAPAASVEPSLFRDVTAETGIAFSYQNGEAANFYTILESLGGGVALLDFDGDGLLDIYATGGGTLGGQKNELIQGLPGKLYRNLGQWRFADVTQQAGLSSAPFYSHGCLVGDFDNDAWPDLLVTGFDGMALYHNQPGGPAGRQFLDVTQKFGLADTRWCTAAAWGDLQGNGRSDRSKTDVQDADHGPIIGTIRAQPSPP